MIHEFLDAVLFPSTFLSGTPIFMNNSAQGTGLGGGSGSPSNARSPCRRGVTSSPASIGNFESRKLPPGIDRLAAFGRTSASAAAGFGDGSRVKGRAFAAEAYPRAAVGKPTRLQRGRKARKKPRRRAGPDPGQRFDKPRGDGLGYRCMGSLLKRIATQSPGLFL